jgi:acetyl esterase/lipase
LTRLQDIITLSMTLASHLLDIISAGDSAGGNLAHALTRYLVEHKDAPDMPAPPSALILLSPWTDLGVSHDYPGSSKSKFSNSDYVDAIEGGFNYAKDAFLGPLGTDAATHNRYISSASLHPSMNIDFTRFP